MARRIQRSSPSAVKPVDSLSSFFELLEPRRMMSVSGLPDYKSFVHTGGLALNGYGTNPATSHHALLLSIPVKSVQRSAWYTTRISIASFSSTFSFLSTKSPTSADGFTFTIQNVGTTAIGPGGHDLGYAGITKSVGIAFNLYNNFDFGSMFGFVAKGKIPNTNVSMGKINLHDGDLFTCTVSYDGTTLSAHLVDTGTGGVFNDSEKVNIPSIIHAHSAYVGFTGGTGANFSTQEVTNWTYGYGPAISSLTASPSTVTKHDSTLTAIVSDPTGTKHLTYSWNLISAPPGARTVTFSNNESHVDNTVVTVFSDGSYTFQATVKDHNGYFATDEVTIVRT